MHSNKSFPKVEIYLCELIFRYYVLLSDGQYFQKNLCKIALEN